MAYDPYASMTPEQRFAANPRGTGYPPMNTQLYAGGSQQFAQQNYGTPTTQPVPQQGILSSAQPLAQYQQPAGQPPIAQAEFERIDPNLRTVQSNETVQGQLAGILASNSPLLQQARARAAEGMQSRGLLNSSIALSAGEDAVIGRGLEIATPDAAAYGLASRDNQLASNTALASNQTQFGLTSRENAGFTNRRGDINVQEAGQDRRQLVTEGGLNTRQVVAEKGSMDRLNISEAGNTARQNSVNATNVQTTGMNNATQLQATSMNNATTMSAAQLSADTSRYTANLSAETQRSVSQLAADSASTLQQNRIAAGAFEGSQQRISQINSNPDYDAATRNRLVQNEVNGAKQAIDLAKGVLEINLVVG